MTKSKKVLSLMCSLVMAASTVSTIAQSANTVHADAFTDMLNANYDQYHSDMNDAFNISNATMTVVTSTTTKKKTNKRKAQDIGNVHFNVNDVSEPSNVTANQIRSFIKRRTEWAGMEDYLIECDNEINLIFLLAVVRTESSGGKYCSGTYNCFNIKDKYGRWHNYKNWEDSIEHFIKLINESYIDPNGRYYEGKGVHDIAIHYDNAAWGDYVENIANDLVKEFAAIDP